MTIHHHHHAVRYVRARVSALHGNSQSFIRDTPSIHHTSHRHLPSDRHRRWFLPRHLLPPLPSPSPRPLPHQERGTAPILPPAGASCRTSHSCLLPPAIPPACYFPTLGPLPDYEAFPSPASLSHRPLSLSCSSFSQSAHNQLPINLICFPHSMQTCYVRCNRANPTVPGWRCSCICSGVLAVRCLDPAQVLADARSTTYLACAPQALMLADARSAAFLAFAPPA